MFVLKSAEALCFRIFDVADETDLTKCRELITTAGTASQRVQLTREGSAYLQFSNPPMTLELGSARLSLGAQTLDVTVGAKVFDHGAISILIRVPIAPGTSMEALIPFADALYDGPAVDALATEFVQKLQVQLRPALTGSHMWEKNEGYTVLLAREIEGAPKATQLLKDADDRRLLARLLLGEVKETQLSEPEQHEVIGNHFTYSENDLAIIEWNAAFLYERAGNADIADLLEIANAQLLELRYYDEVLDRELSRMYDLIEEEKGGSILHSPYKKLLRELMQTLIELSEFIERIENALKIVGDVYLARVYEAAVGQLRIKQWTEQVSRKHRLLQQTYGLLKGEVDTDRALTLEIMVVVLILLEMLIAVGQLVGGRGG